MQTKHLLIIIYNFSWTWYRWIQNWTSSFYCWWVLRSTELCGSVWRCVFILTKIHPLHQPSTNLIVLFKVAGTMDMNPATPLEQICRLLRNGDSWPSSAMNTQKLMDCKSSRFMNVNGKRWDDFHWVCQNPLVSDLTWCIFILRVGTPSFQDNLLWKLMISWKRSWQMICLALFNVTWESPLVWKVTLRNSFLSLKTWRFHWKMLDR